MAEAARKQKPNKIEAPKSEDPFVLRRQALANEARRALRVKITLPEPPFPITTEESDP